MSKPYASDFARNADNQKWIGTPYNVWDCQEFVEQMLHNVGISKNWKGSNDMWRNAVEERQNLTECELLPGMWLFTVKNDGGERKRGYNDNMGNAAHVGIYLGNGRVIHSTTGGVQWDVITSKRWTHGAKCVLLDYGDRAGGDLFDSLFQHLITSLSNAYHSWKENISSG